MCCSTKAKAVQRMKETSSTGLRVSNLPVAVSADKAKMLMERDLKLYITQLTTAKGVCERQIRKFGGEDYQQDHLEGEQLRSDFPRPIPFDTVMMNQKCLSYFLKFLDRNRYGDLLLFWQDVQILSLSDEVFQRTKYIYSKYLAAGGESSIYPDSNLLATLEASLQTESFTSGDTHPCVEELKQIQNSVYTELHEQHYESFLYSEDFKEFMEGETENEVAFR